VFLSPTRTALVGTRLLRARTVPVKAYGPSSFSQRKWRTIQRCAPCRILETTQIGRSPFFCRNTVLYPIGVGRTARARTPRAALPGSARALVREKESRRLRQRPRPSARLAVSQSRRQRLLGRLKRRHRTGRVDEHRVSLTVRTLKRPIDERSLRHRESPP